MSYSLSSFSDDFFYGLTTFSDRPTSVEQALISMEDEAWEAMIEDLDLYDGINEVIERIKETDTCVGLYSPVEVWIDPDGFYTILVY